MNGAETGSVPTRTLAVLALVVLMVCAAFVRNDIYRDGLLLWEDVVRKSPGKARGFNNLGTIYQGRDRYADALMTFRRVVELEPLAFLFAYGNIGNVYIDMREYGRAEEIFTRILSIQSADYQSYVGRGKARYLLGKHRAALADFDRALAMRPDVARYYLYRAEALLELNERSLARQDIIRSCTMGWQEGCGRLKELDQEDGLPR